MVLLYSYTKMTTLDISLHSKFQCTSGSIPSLSVNTSNLRDTVLGQRSSHERVSLCEYLALHKNLVSPNLYSHGCRRRRAERGARDNRIRISALFLLTKDSTVLALNIILNKKKRKERKEKTALLGMCQFIDSLVPWP